MLRTLPIIAVLLVSFAVPQSAAAAETKIAVVDILKLINNHPDIAALRTFLDKEEQKARAMIERAKVRADKLRQKILKAADGSPERRTMQRSYEKQAWLDEYEYKAMLGDARQKYVGELESIHSAVKALISRYARENGIEVVLQVASEKLNATDRNDFVMKTALRGVIYAAPHLDITAKIQAMFGK